MMGKLEGILVHTDYASMYLGKIAEMAEKVEERKQVGATT
jgi:hypothetical protein